jgi:hypothetical protein
VFIEVSVRKAGERVPEAALLYRLEPDTLLPAGVSVSTSFEIAHEELVREGKLRSRLDTAYFDALMAGIRYWDGQSWLAPDEWKRRMEDTAGGAGATGAAYAAGTR